MTTILARFRTNERATRAYAELELAATVTPPELEGSRDGRPWVLKITYDEAQQPVVLRIVGRYGGVTFQGDPK